MGVEDNYGVLNFLQTQIVFEVQIKIYRGYTKDGQESFYCTITLISSYDMTRMNWELAKNYKREVVNY